MAFQCIQCKQEYIASCTMYVHQQRRLLQTQAEICLLHLLQRLSKFLQQFLNAAAKLVLTKPHNVHSFFSVFFDFVSSGLTPSARLKFDVQTPMLLAAVVHALSQMQTDYGCRETK
jgi:hypothetical protein